MRTESGPSADRVRPQEGESGHSEDKVMQFRDENQASMRTESGCRKDRVKLFRDERQSQ